MAAEVKTTDWPLDTNPVLSYKRRMAVSSKLFRMALTIVLLCGCAAAQDFSWDWHVQEVVGRDDPSLANTSQLSDRDRTELINAITAQLDKPMAARGYENDRIREVASITRLRFVDLGGDGKPLILASAISMEAGCDLNNCPFWIFRKTPDGYGLLLDTIAASYTVRPEKTNGLSDLVIMRHVSASESRLTLYRYQDNKYVDSGCYVATWPPPKDGEIQDPAIAPCKTDSGEATPQPNPQPEPQAAPPPSAQPDSQPTPPSNPQATPPPQ